MSLISRLRLSEEMYYSEDITSAMCPASPNAVMFIRDLIDSIPNVVPVCIHENDSLTITDSYDFWNDYSPPLPGVMVDRYQFSDNYSVFFYDNLYSTDTNTFIKDVRLRLAQIAPASVSFSSKSYTDTSVTVQVNATILNSIHGDYRLNLYVVEDSVIHTGFAWNQENSVSGTSVPIIGALPQHNP
jgi:hypothetical protein